MRVLAIAGRVGLLLVVVVLLALIVFRTIGRPVTTRLLGEARVRTPEVDQGWDIHASPLHQGSLLRRAERLTGLSGALIAHYASLELPDWAEESKVHAPRVLFAKLMTGVDIAAVNEYLLSAEPTAPSGSSWELRPVADYDFTEIILAAILMEFEDDPQILWPQTQEHLVDTLLIESGYRVRWTVPGSLGTVQETENHILMTEVSRYLRNLWLTRNRAMTRRHERRAAGHASRVAAFLTELDESGLYEFNSQPYGGYTMAAALVAFAYAGDLELQEAARRLLDRQAMQFALSSDDLRRVVPFRRQLGRADRTSLFEDPMSAIASIWVGFQPGLDSPEDLKNAHHAVVAALTGYRPGEATVRETLGVPEETLLVIGRGQNASPEIHSTGLGYHISSGGVGFGRAAGIAARPTVLLIDDGARDLDELFRIPGVGRFTEWNNTGVHQRLAVGPSPVGVPDGVTPVARSGPFELYLVGNTGVITASAQGFGLIHVPADEPFAAFERIVTTNDESQLRHAFVDASGKRFEYEVDAPRGTWVMRAPLPRELTREYAGWPRLQTWNSF